MTAYGSTGLSQAVPGFAKAELCDNVLCWIHAADGAEIPPACQEVWNGLPTGGLTTGCSVWWYSPAMSLSRTKTIYYIGGPLNGDEHPDSPEETRFVTCAGIVYSACPSDPYTFTPGGMSVADAMRAMKLEKEFMQ